MMTMQLVVLPMALMIGVDDVVVADVVAVAVVAVVNCTVENVKSCRCCCCCCGQLQYGRVHDRKCEKLMLTTMFQSRFLQYRHIVQQSNTQQMLTEHDANTPKI